ncbi:MAG: HAMP domain-containing histidine kinase, partial [Burkholderiales bacterium]|nr:HAMP domain-containing histidine kinase [Burkholderiales bacterium]
APIRKAVKQLGHRLTRRLENERAFSAHAAHALRTPLAGMDAQLAVALRECPPDVRPRLKQAREAANRLKRVVSTLLTLFRSGIEAQWQPLNLATLLRNVSIDRLEISLTQPADVEADPDLLTAALINLLDNVVRHGGQHVRVQVQTDTRFQTISLHDDGPGVPQERLHELQRALARQDYAGHMGLGLMMADIVARAHGGYLHIRNADSGPGMTAELTLRRQPHA